MRVAIIGGGASGVFAALSIKKQKPEMEVVIYERNNKILKKVGVTGNGRCNLGNIHIKKECFQKEEPVEAMCQKGYETKALQFFEELGLFTVTDEAGRVYPKSNQASTVVELLTRELFYKKVKVITDTNISEIHKIGDKYLVGTFKDPFDAVIFSIGTQAGISEVNENASLLKQLPVKLKTYEPGLVGFKVENSIQDLAGVRSMVAVKLLNHLSKGEIIFKEQGISGICIMDLSIFYEESYLEDELSLDFMSDYSFDELMGVIRRKVENDPYIHLHNLMFGAVHNKLLQHFNQGYPNVKVTSLDNETLFEYLKQFKDFRLKIKGTYGFLNAQVAKGGVMWDSLNGFELKAMPHVYVCGEALDEVGICGGYNLWFAFTSGLMVADEICK